MIIIHDDDVDINNNQGNEDSDPNNGDGKKSINIYKGNGSNLKFEWLHRIFEIFCTVFRRYTSDRWRNTYIEIYI